MNKELLKLLPSDQELAKLSAKTQVVMTSRNELLSQIGTLDLENMAIKIKQEEDVNNNNKGEHRCHICGSSYRVIWVVPFDAKVSTG